MEDYKIKESRIKGLVTIIVPTHNRGNLISPTIKSILEQTYTKIEVIVVDDHSTDNTEENILEFVQQNNHIHYFKSERYGACAARNLGLSKSNGEFIQFFDDDDIMLPNHIEKKLIKLIESKSDFVTCNFKYFKNSTQNIVGFRRIDNFTHNCQLQIINSGFPAPSFLCRIEVFKTIGFWNEKTKCLQDLALFHRLFKYNIKGLWLEDFLFLVRIHSNTITNSNRNSKSGYSERIKSLEYVREEWGHNKMTSLSITIKQISICLSAFNSKHDVVLFGMLLKTILKHPLDLVRLLQYSLKFKTFKLPYEKIFY